MRVPVSWLATTSTLARRPRRAHGDPRRPRPRRRGDRGRSAQGLDDVVVVEVERIDAIEGADRIRLATVSDGHRVDRGRVRRVELRGRLARPVRTGRRGAARRHGDRAAHDARRRLQRDAVLGARARARRGPRGPARARRRRRRRRRAGRSSRRSASRPTRCSTSPSRATAPTRGASRGSRGTSPRAPAAPFRAVEPAPPPAVATRADELVAVADRRPRPVRPVHRDRARGRSASARRRAWLARRLERCGMRPDQQRRRRLQLRDARARPAHARLTTATASPGRRFAVRRARAGRAPRRSSTARSSSSPQGSARARGHRRGPRHLRRRRRRRSGSRGSWAAPSTEIGEADDRRRARGRLVRRHGGRAQRQAPPAAHGGVGALRAGLRPDGVRPRRGAGGRAAGGELARTLRVAAGLVDARGDAARARRPRRRRRGRSPRASAWPSGSTRSRGCSRAIGFAVRDARRRARGDRADGAPRRAPGALRARRRRRGGRAPPRLRRAARPRAVVARARGARAARRGAPRRCARRSSGSARSRRGPRRWWGSPTPSSWATTPSACG